VLEHALLRFPADAELLGALAEAYERSVESLLRRGDRPAAERMLERFRASFPGDPRIARLEATLRGRGAPAAR
jgi:hypothetical protein